MLLIGQYKKSKQINMVKKNHENKKIKMNKQENFFKIFQVCRNNKVLTKNNNYKIKIESINKIL